MDPIRINRPNVPPTGPVGPAEKKPGSDKAFEVGSATPQASDAAPTANATPNYDRVRARIAECFGQSLPREQILDRVVGDEARRALGAEATPKAVADITDAFKRDPGLTQLFDKLLAKAGVN